MSQAPPTRRRWYQFGILSLFVVITAFAIAFGMWTNAARLQRRSVDGLGANGFAFNFAFYDFQQLADGGVDPNLAPRLPSWLVKNVGEDFCYRIVSVNLSGAMAKAERLEHLKGLRHLNHLGLDNAEITEPIAEAIGSMTDLEHLSLQFCDITDAKLRPLVGLKKLKRLWLSFDKVGDEGLAYLSGLHQLNLLQLQNNRLTSAGLAHLTPLSNLETLVLWGNQGINDEGIEQLSKMTNLRSLSLGKTGVSDDGFKKLQRALSNTKIKR